MAAVAEKAARIRKVAATVLVASVGSAACSSAVLDDMPTASAVIVGSGPAAEDEVLAHLYAGALRTTGIEVQVRTAVADPFAALDSAEVTLVPGYSGRLLSHYDPGASPSDAEDVFEALAQALPDELTLSDYASAQDRAVLLATGADAAAVSRVGDLAPRCPDLTLVFTDGFESGGGVDALAAAGCSPGEVRRAGDAEVLTEAVRPDTILGVTGTSSTLVGLGQGSDVVVVPDAPDTTARDRTDGEADPPVFPAQNLVPVFRKGTLADAQLDALRTIAGELTTGDLGELRARVDDGESPDTVAAAWLAEHT